MTFPLLARATGRTFLHGSRSPRATSRRENGHPTSAGEVALTGPLLRTTLWVDARSSRFDDPS